MQRTLLLVLASVVAGVSTHAIAQANVPNDANSLTILTAFRQANGPSPVVNPSRNYGNCVSIAMIKTAMATFGIDGVVQSPSTLPTDNSAASYTVALRDGHSVVLSHDEVDTAISNLRYNSGFVLPNQATGDKAILFKANFLYAVMAKELLARKADVPYYASRNPQTFQDALAIMGGGIDVAVDATATHPMINQIGVLLGVDLTDVTNTASEPTVPYLYALRKHTVFAYSGEGDDFGQRHSFETILKGHSTWITRTWGRNSHPSKYIIKTP